MQIETEICERSARAAGNAALHTTKNGEVQPFVGLCALICLYFTDSVTGGLADPDFWTQSACVVAATSLSLILSSVPEPESRLISHACAAPHLAPISPGQKVRKTVSVFSSRLFFIPASLLDFSGCQRFFGGFRLRRGGNMNSAMQLPV